MKQCGEIQKKKQLRKERLEAERSGVNFVKNSYSNRRKVTMAGPVPISQKEETKAEDKKYNKAGEGWRDVNAEDGVRWKVNKKKKVSLEGDPESDKHQMR